MESFCRITNNLCRAFCREMKKYVVLSQMLTKYDTTIFLGWMIILETILSYWPPSGWHKLCNPTSRALRTLLIMRIFENFCEGWKCGYPWEVKRLSSVLNLQSSIFSPQSSEIPKNNAFSPKNLIRYFSRESSHFEDKIQEQVRILSQLVPAWPPLF